MSIIIGKFCVIDETAIIGEGSFVGDFINIRKDVEIGRNCTLTCHNIVSQGAIVGDNVFFAPGGMVLGRDADNKRGIVEIGNDVFIGAGAVICAGVKIGDGAKIGALSFVDKDCAPGCFYFGRPAKLSRKKGLMIL